MRSTQCLITDRRLQAHAADFLQTHLPLRTHKRVCTPPAMWSVILWAAAWHKSLEHACGLLRDAPCSDTLHNALLPQIADHAKLQRHIDRLLLAGCRRPASSKRRRYPVAIDLNLIPYYGQPGSTPWIYVNKERQGTRRFHAYATAYLLWHGQRYTVAMTCVRDKEELAAVVRRLLRQVSKSGLRLRYLLLDRGFYSVAVFRYLQAARVPFLMPAIVRGRRPTEAQPVAGGTRRFTQCKRSGWYSYQLTSRHRERKATVSICVQCRNHAGHKGKHGRYVWLFAYWGLRPSSYRWVRETYRRRFGIETSYRQLHQGRARTSSRNAELRLLFVGVALVLRNLWVWWHWEVLSQRRRGGRRLRSALLPLAALLERIAWACGDLFGGLQPLQAPQPPSNKEIPPP
jgi:putative transposase